MKNEWKGQRRGIFFLQKRNSTACAVLVDGCTLFRVCQYVINENYGDCKWMFCIIIIQKEKKSQNRSTVFFVAANKRTFLDAQHCCSMCKYTSGVQQQYQVASLSTIIIPKLQPRAERKEGRCNPFVSQQFFCCFFRIFSAFLPSIPINNQIPDQQAVYWCVQAFKQTFCEFFHSIAIHSDLFCFVCRGDPKSIKISPIHI